MRPLVGRLAGAAILALTLWLPAYPHQAAAQPTPVGDTLGLRVYLMTMGPGPAVWERFGHNAIWIHDSARGTDIAYNYGLFDFRQEDFLLHFVQGHMRYWMAGMDAERSATAYLRQGRSLWVQELDLTATQRAELVRFLEWNAEDQNKFYDYNYYWDNCSTRVRDALDLVLGGAIKRQTDNGLTAFTYRDHTRRLLQHDILAYLGIMLGLGQPVDRPITEWAAGFLPVRLQESLRRVSISSGGGSRPLVVSERTVHQSETLPEPEAIPKFWFSFLLIGCAIGALFIVLAWLGGRSPVARGGFRLLATVWSFVMGVAGVLLAFLWWFTDHATSAANENLLQANPLSLFLAAALLAGAFGARRPEPTGRWLAVVVAVLSLAGVVLKILPAMYQVNGEVIALLLPAHLGLSVGAWHVLRGGTAPSPDAS